MSDTLLVTKVQLEELARKEDKENISEASVSVTIIDFRWFWHGGKNFFAFARLLDNQLPSGFYSSNFTVQLLNQLFFES